LRPFLGREHALALNSLDAGDLATGLTLSAHVVHHFRGLGHADIEQRLLSLFEAVDELFARHLSQFIGLHVLNS